MSATWRLKAGRPGPACSPPSGPNCCADAVRRHDVGSIRQLATALGRDYSNVHADVKALTTEGLLSSDGGRLSADYDVIEAKIAL